MKINTQNRIFRGLTVCVLLCALIVLTLSPAAFAASTTTYWGEVVVSTLNCRSGPGLSYDIVHTYSTGDKFVIIGETNGTVDGYVWYQNERGWVAQTGGLKISTGSSYTDYICAYDPYGELSWEHECTMPNPDFQYHLEVDNEGYRITCDCGWWYYKNITQSIDPETGEELYVFLGLDTDGDWEFDLKPGQTKDLPNRATGEYRQYQILEVIGSANLDTPTVTLQFGDAENNLIAEYTFNWSVDVHVEAYGIVMVGNDGTKKIHYCENDFLLYDRLSDFFLGDSPVRYQVDLSIKDMNGVQVYRHVEFGFTLAPPGEGGLGPLEWVTSVVRNVCDFISDILDFFGLSFIFTDEDSPFRFLMGG